MLVNGSPTERRHEGVTIQGEGQLQLQKSLYPLCIRSCRVHGLRLEYFEMGERTGQEEHIRTS